MPADRLRVGIIANSFDPLFGERAGGHVHMIEIAKRWSAFDLCVFAPEQTRELFKRDLPAAEFIGLPSCERVTTNKAFVFIFRSLAAVMVAPRLRECDAIICVSQFLPDVVPAVVAGASRATVVLWHLLEPPWKREGSWFVNSLAYIAEGLGRLLVDLWFKNIIVGSNLLARQMRLAGRKRFWVTTNGVEHLGFIDHEAAAVSPRRGALFVGRLHPTKGLEDLLIAWGLARASLPDDEQLTIAGGGSAEYEAHLRDLVERKGLKDSIVFAGPVSEVEKRRLLADSALFAFPSKEEGWGIAVAEAMAFGLPCLTYDLDIFREIFIAGRLTVPTGKVGALADLIVTLLTNETIRRRYAEEALELSRAFSWSRAAQIEGDALSEIAGNAGRKPTAHI